MTGRGDIDFYWLGSGDVPPPAALQDLHLKRPAARSVRLTPFCIVFFEPAATDREASVSQLRAEHGGHFYLVVVVESEALRSGAALLRSGADDVCSRAELERPEMIIARAEMRVARQATQSSRLGPDDQADFIRAGIEALPIPIFFKDAQGVYLECNTAFSQAIGRSPADIIGKTIFETAHPDSAEGYAELDRQLIATGGVQIFEGSHRFNDGVIHEAAVVKAAFRDDAGRVAGFVGAMLDITDRIKAQRLLQQREQEFRTLVENSPDSIARYDRNCRRTYINPAH
jgi:PAS domain S-box-containing protein